MLWPTNLNERQTSTMPKVIDIISHMRTLEGTFPKREQLVADFVLANLEQISFLSQYKIAESWC